MGEGSGDKVETPDLQVHPAVVIETGLRLHPTVGLQVTCLQKTSSCGVRELPPDLGGPVDNSFLLDVPFCWQFLRWQVIFQRFGVTWVPDVLFLEDGGFSPLTPVSDPEAAALRAGLDAWDDRDASKLAKLIQALLIRYASFQREKMQALAARDSRLQFELATAIGLRDDGNKPEMLVQSIGEDMQKAVFLLPVEGVDLSPLQSFLSRMWSTSGGFPAAALEAMEHSVVLRAEYLITSSGSSNAAPDLELRLPSQLSGVVGALPLPTWSNGMCLMEYLPQCASAINRHVTAAAENASLRQGLLNALYETELSWPLDVDTRTCRSASFQMEDDGVTFRVYISIPEHFPEQQPLLVLERVEGAEPESTTFTNYAWSPRWPAKEMARRIYALLQEEVPKHHPLYEPPSLGLLHHFHPGGPSPRGQTSSAPSPAGAPPSPDPPTPSTGTGSQEATSTASSHRSSPHDKSSSGSSHRSGTTQEKSRGSSSRSTPHEKSKLGRLFDKLK